LAVLGLLSHVAEERPLIGTVDDVQWLDRASAQVLAFVTRRLEAESVGLVFALSGGSDELAGLPELVVEGLSAGDAQALLESALTAPLDPPVRNRVIREARGNPLALLNPRSVLPPGLAGGFGLSGAVPLEGRIEESFRRRIGGLPPDTRRLMRLAATDPAGEPSPLWRAAVRLGIGPEAAAPAVEAGLVAFGASGVCFCHPLARSAAYGTASLGERHDLHRALAEAIDPRLDPEAHAWHLAEAAQVPDEEVAEELERCAGRGQARGGFAAAGAFLERAAMLTPEPGRRADRLLAAARARRTARRLDPLNVELARETHLEALMAAIWAGVAGDDAAMLDAAEAARAAPPGREPPRAPDVLLDALALRLTEGYAAAAPALTGALRMFFDLKARAEEAVRWFDLMGLIRPGMIALEVWDADAWHELLTRHVQFARDTGALVQLQFAVNSLAVIQLLGGELGQAAALIEENRLIADASGNPPYGFAEIMLAAWRGREAQVSELTEAAVLEAAAGRPGRWVTFAGSARAMLYNGLGQHDAARDCAWPETARKRTVETRDDLTAQEGQIATLAGNGLSNPEIGARLFISPGTVKYHLRKIFVKLDIHSRSELERALTAIRYR
ncbi:MAG TPA: LuxR C-terminal-related transcriptional regulator, partial [Solirubrobacteraceae bacterium]|nr:LuxR C-terminal-related transcriptional regulator [Solirubrobacteraceae bacterium]